MALDDLKAGDSLPELKTTPDKYLPHRYAGASGDFNPIHIDAEFAKQVGLPSNILHNPLMFRLNVPMFPGRPGKLGISQHPSHCMFHTLCEEQRIISTLQDGDHRYTQAAEALRHESERRR